MPIARYLFRVRSGGGFTEVLRCNSIDSTLYLVVSQLLRIVGLIPWEQRLPLVQSDHKSCSARYLKKCPGFNRPYSPPPIGMGASYLFYSLAVSAFGDSTSALTLSGQTAVPHAISQSKNAREHSCLLLLLSAVVFEVLCSVLQ